MFSFDLSGTLIKLVLILSYQNPNIQDVNTRNQIHITKEFGWFIGGFENNRKHRHYGIQLSIPLKGQMIIKTANKTIKTEHPILIKSNVEHQICSANEHFLLLMNPASTIGHYWNHLAKAELQEISIPPTKKLKEHLLKNGADQLFTTNLNSIIREYDCFCSSSIHLGDKRITDALAYLAANTEQVLPAEEVAQHCHLSTSRFLHLFKEQTGITYRRTQLWNKLSNSFSQFEKLSLTAIAYQQGFSDSAHFSRSFKENFGFSPREFLKISQFIQV